MRMTAKEAAAIGINLPAAAPKSKYKNEKIVVDGIKFDSKKEARYYCELVLKKKARIIKYFQLQPRIVLQEGFRTEDGKKIREIVYKADFKVIYPDGKVEIVDTKGFRTKEYLIKKKMLLFRYPEINFLEV